MTKTMLRLYGNVLFISVLFNAFLFAVYTCGLRSVDYTRARCSQDGPGAMELLVPWPRLRLIMGQDLRGASGRRDYLVP